LVRVAEPSSTGQFLRQVIEDLVARGLDVLEQLLHQLVVVIGQRLEHRETRGLLSVERVAFERYHFRGRMLLVDEGPFEREIDETGDDLPGKGRNLPQQQLAARGRLQHRQHVMNGGVGLVDLVEEQEARNLLGFQLAQNELKLRNLLLVELADHDRGVDCGQRRAHVLDEFDRAGAIDESIAVAHEIGGGDGELDAHLVVARLFAGVTHRVARIDGALALNRAGAGEDRFEQRGLAALERAHQRDAPWTRYSCAIRAILCHVLLPNVARDAAFCETVRAGSYRFRLEGGLARGAKVSATAPEPGHGTPAAARMYRIQQVVTVGWTE
jgi:hypothetical protein